jgi:hypothetical protein
MEFCTGGDLEKIFNEKNRIPQPVFFLFGILEIFYYVGACENNEPWY